MSTPLNYEDAKFPKLLSDHHIHKIRNIWMADKTTYTGKIASLGFLFYYNF